MIFGRLLPKLAKSGDWQRTLMILGKGDFGPEKYNESYLSFIENQHRKQGLDVIQSAHEKFPSDTVRYSGLMPSGSNNHFGIARVSIINVISPKANSKELLLRQALVKSNISMDDALIISISFEFFFCYSIFLFSTVTLILSFYSLKDNSWELSKVPRLLWGLRYSLNILQKATQLETRWC